jgi:hypothetical protein
VHSARFGDERLEVRCQLRHADVLLGLLVVVPELDRHVGCVFWDRGGCCAEDTRPVAAGTERGGCCAVVAVVCACCACVERRVEEAGSPAWVVG